VFLTGVLTINRKTIMKKTTLLLIGALAFVLQSATAQIILYSANFGKVFFEPGGGGQPRDDNGNVITAYVFGGNITYWGVEEVLDSTYATTTRAAVLDWTMSGVEGFYLDISPSVSSLAAGAGSLGGLRFSYDIYTGGAAAAGVATPFTIWFDQFPLSIKTFDASISPVITTDGRWTHVSFTLDQLTPRRALS
jgi:hypothetical protein